MNIRKDEYYTEESDFTFEVTRSLETDRISDDIEATHLVTDHVAPVVIYDQLTD